MFRLRSILPLLIVMLVCGIFPVLAQQTSVVIIRVLDSNGAAVPSVLLKVDNLEVRCGSDGRVTLKLPAGEHAVEAFFMGVAVARSRFQTPLVMTHDITAKIFSLRVHVMYGADPVAGAVVRAYVSEQVSEETTSSSGVAIFKQLPASSLSIHVFKDGKRMSERTLVLERNDEVVIEREYYYAIRFHLVDVEKLPAQNVRVQAGSIFSFTDVNGETILELKKGSHRLEMSLYGLSVYSTMLAVSESGWFNATISASTLLVILLDETQQPFIGRAFIHVGRTNMTANTDATGLIKIKQIPHGEIGVSTEVGVITSFQHAEKQVVVNVATRELKLVVSTLFAYQLGSLRIRVRANIGELPLKGARIQVASSTGIITQTTDSRGIAEVDVPLYLENPAVVRVTIRGSEQEKTQIVVAGTSPLMLFIVPLGLFPFVLFKILTGIYRRGLLTST